MRVMLLILLMAGGAYGQSVQPVVQGNCSWVYWSLGRAEIYDNGVQVGNTDEKWVKIPANGAGTGQPPNANWTGPNAVRESADGTAVAKGQVTGGVSRSTVGGKPYIQARAKFSTIAAVSPVSNNIALGKADVTSKVRQEYKVTAAGAWSVQQVAVKFVLKSTPTVTPPPTISNPFESSTTMRCELDELFVEAWYSIHHINPDGSKGAWKVEYKLTTTAQTTTTWLPGRNLYFEGYAVKKVPRTITWHILAGVEPGPNPASNNVVDWLSRGLRGVATPAFGPVINTQDNEATATLFDVRDTTFGP
mgnify:CR=1 FL=1